MTFNRAQGLTCLSGALLATTAAVHPAAAQSAFVSIYSDTIASADHRSVYAVATTHVSNDACTDGARTTSLEVFGPSTPYYAWSRVEGDAVAAMLPYTSGPYTIFTTIEAGSCGRVLDSAESRQQVGMNAIRKDAGPADPRTPLIDGAVNPEQIDDRIAVRNVFPTIAVPLMAGPIATKRLMAKVSRMGLSADDMHILRRELDAVHAQSLTHFYHLASLRHAAMLNADSAAAAASIRNASQQATELWLQGYSTLLNRLSRDGASKLRAYIDTARTKIKVFPNPM